MTRFDRRHFVKLAMATTAAWAPLGRGRAESGRPVREMTLQLVDARQQPVLSIDSPGAAGNQFGFEGGCVIELDATYHLFTTEMPDRPVWVHTRLAHWTSTDMLVWRRRSTLFESTGEFTGADPRASLWEPTPIYDEESHRWNLFYVAYRCAPNKPDRWLNNSDGRIWRAVSERSGREGIAGPYRDRGVVMQPDEHTQPWEGLQGVDSFFPYRKQEEEGWFAIYGSAQTETKAMPTRVGLARAPSLDGPWERMEGNPLPIEPAFAENPIVRRLDDGSFLAVYDSDVPDSFGSSWSPDGMHWKPGRHVRATARSHPWTHYVRTPLGLISTANGRFAVPYTGWRNVKSAFPDMSQPGDSCVGVAYFTLRPV